MILYVNENNEVKDVDVTNDETLIPLEVIEDEFNINPFKDWSVAKICCFQVEVTIGIVTMFTPYVDSRLIEHIDKLGKTDETAASDIVDTQIALTETFEKTEEADALITDIQLALVEVYEMLTGGAE